MIRSKITLRESTFAFKSLKNLSCQIKKLYSFAIGYPLKIKMADHLIRCSVFNLEHDGAFNFLINKRFSVNKLVKVLVKIS